MITPTPREPLRTDNPPPVNLRLRSLDALRGFDMFWIIGAAYFVHALEKLSDHGAVQFVAHQLSHKEWEGFAFYDLIHRIKVRAR